MYRFLYNCVFCLAFINFLNYWIYLFFSEKNNSYSKRNHNQESLKAVNSSPSIRLEAVACQYNERQSLTLGKSFSDHTLTENKAWKEDKIQTRGFHTNYLHSFCFIISSSLWFVLTLLIFFRIIQSHHFPLANFYEALIFLTWCLGTLNLIILFEPTNTSLLTFSPVIGFHPITRQNLSILPQEKAASHDLKQETEPAIKRKQWGATQFSVQKQISGAILAPCILFIIAFAQLNLEETITPLVPALKSNWLLMHVSIMICSYTTFMVGGLLAFFLLIQSLRFPFYNKQSDAMESKQWRKPQLLTMFSSKNDKQNLDPVASQNYKMQTIPSSSSVASLRVKSPMNASGSPLASTSSGTQEMDYNLMNKNVNSNFPSINRQAKLIDSSARRSSSSILEGFDKMHKKNLYKVLDNLSYRMMSIGFPLFTLGILSGAVWANEAWGSYWSWDIKEVGSFINWLIVALYFHCRYKNFISLSHTVAFISLCVLFFNFFGISLGIFGSSLHAYGASS